MNVRAHSGYDDLDASYTLEDRYRREAGPVFLTGTQALVRIMIEQARSDRVAGLKTAGLVSGYRGSPLGGFDQELWRQRKLLNEFDVRFEPGLNEDLGATMLWGAQQIDAFPGKRVEGVFSMWYGKGPGVDRTGDVFRNANVLGTSKRGGVLAIAGDDHAAQSSMFPHQTDQVFEGSMIPIIFPASVDEFVQFGLFGYALSRFSGLWVGYKAITETVESGRSMILGQSAPFVVPTDIDIPGRGFGYDTQVQWPAERAELEHRLVEERLPAAQAFARANPVDRTVVRRDDARVGIVTVGKAHGDLLAALTQLGLDESSLADKGIALYKVGMIWPIESAGIQAFSVGLSAVFIIEEKRSFVERQIKETLFNLPASCRPEIFGKRGPNDTPLLAATMEFSPAQVARALRIFLEHTGTSVQEQISHAPGLAQRIIPLGVEGPSVLVRKPFFCAGCPHNTSTRLPDGSYAAAGIGCHIMALGKEGTTSTFCQMGGEGVQWVGLSTFSTLPHMFVNLGDGTYQHSGSLAIRQAVAAKTPVTYKILFNDAVAMTGGQPTEGSLTVPRVVQQVAAEGVSEIVVVSDNPGAYKGKQVLPGGIEVVHRDALDAVQKRLREYEGVSVIVYDQTCAAEKRRRRKRGKLIDPAQRVVINPAVCEGCGDCSIQSNCIAIEPVETDLGRKRAVNQSTCNKDASCLKGFCPSFVTVEGLQPKKPDQIRIKQLEAQYRATLAPLALAEGHRADTAHTRILVTGIGGTGVVTIGAILAMAAHLEGKGASTLDFTGLAQKNGAVISHVQIAARREQIVTSRIEVGAGDLLIGCDSVVAASSDALARVKRGTTHAVLNSAITPTADFVTNGDLPISAGVHQSAIESALGSTQGDFWDCSAAAQTLFGDSIATNMMMVGYAFQRGQIPVSEAAIVKAIELNGAAVEFNQRAFFWGRVLAHDPLALDAVNGSHPGEPLVFGLDRFVDARIKDLTAYQNTAYAKRYRQLVDSVAAAETRSTGAKGALTEAAARNYFKVLAYKDEYEVARLHSSTAFAESLTAAFDGQPRMKFHMAPPVLTRRDPVSGRRNKIALNGAWMRTMLRVLQHGKILRGTAFDPFGRQSDRRMERQLIADFENDVRMAIDRLSSGNVKSATALLGIPSMIRGYGIIKERAYTEAQTRRDAYRRSLSATLA